MVSICICLEMRGEVVLILLAGGLASPLVSACSAEMQKTRKHMFPRFLSAF